MWFMYMTDDAEVWLVTIMTPQFLSFVHVCNESTVKTSGFMVNRDALFLHTQKNDKTRAAQ